MLPSAFTKLVAVTIPDITAPPAEKLTPIPGTLTWLILELPMVTSFEIVAELASAPSPKIILLPPVVNTSPAEAPMATLLEAEVMLYKLLYPSDIL